ncbi:MAG: hypothetical protein U5R31_03065 [Acidimicrobiia bacterium]|nr:hypothetical protein [Acidimicrobiia bacterium]
MRVDRRIYGPHPKVRGARMLLAFEGQEMSVAEFESVLAQAAGQSEAAPSHVVGDGRSRFVSGIEVVEVDTSGEVQPVDDPEPVEGDEEDETETVGLTPLGGGWYELPDGERVRGREAAEAALAEIEGG